MYPKFTSKLQEFGEGKVTCDESTTYKIEYENENLIVFANSGSGFEELTIISYCCDPNWELTQGNWYLRYGLNCKKTRSSMKKLVFKCLFISRLPLERNDQIRIQELYRSFS